MRLNKIIILGKGKEYNGRTRFKRIITNVLGKENTNNMYELKEATLYSAFRRLEQAGYISSYWGNEDKGARRRYYTITELGIKVYEQNKKDWEEAKNLIDTLIGEER